MYRLVLDEDLLEQDVEAIVCPASIDPKLRGGLDRRIYKKAGEKKMQRARSSIGKLTVTRCAVTDGFELGRRVIHVVTPYYFVKDSEHLLRLAYMNVLKTAQEEGIRSIAFPLLSAGAMGFPPVEAREIAESVLSDKKYDDVFDCILLIFLTDKRSLVERILDTDYTDYSEEQLEELKTIVKYEHRDQKEHIEQMYHELRSELDIIRAYEKEREGSNDPEGYDMTVFRNYIKAYIGEGKKYSTAYQLEEELRETPDAFVSEGGNGNIGKIVRGTRDTCSRDIAVSLALAFHMSKKDTLRFMIAGAVRFPDPEALEDHVIMSCIQSGIYDCTLIREAIRKAEKDKKENKNKARMNEM